MTDRVDDETVLIARRSVSGAAGSHDTVDLPSRDPSTAAPSAAAQSAAAQSAAGQGRGRWVRSQLVRLVALTCTALGLVLLVAAAGAGSFTGGGDSSGSTTALSGVPVVVSAPGILDLTGPQFVVSATAARAGQQVFIGVARADDVQAWLADVARVEVQGTGSSHSLVTRSVSGPTSVTDPALADIWLQRATGTSTVSLTWPRTAGEYRVVVAGSGSPGALGSVSMTWAAQPASSPAPALAAVGALLVVLGIAGLFAVGRVGRLRGSAADAAGAGGPAGARSARRERAARRRATTASSPPKVHSATAAVTPATGLLRPTTELAAPPVEDLPPGVRSLRTGPLPFVQPQDDAPATTMLPTRRALREAERAAAKKTGGWSAMLTPARGLRLPSGGATGPIPAVTSPSTGSVPVTPSAGQDSWRTDPGLPGGVGDVGVAEAGEPTGELGVRWIGDGDHTGPQRPAVMLETGELSLEHLLDVRSGDEGRTHPVHVTEDQP